MSFVFTNRMVVVVCVCVCIFLKDYNPENSEVEILIIYIKHNWIIINQFFINHLFSFFLCVCISVIYVIMIEKKQEERLRILSLFIIIIVVIIIIIIIITMLICSSFFIIHIYWGYIRSLQAKFFFSQTNQIICSIHFSFG